MSKLDKIRDSYNKQKLIIPKSPKEMIVGSFSLDALKDLLSKNEFQEDLYMLSLDYKMIEKIIENYDGEDAEKMIDFATYIKTMNQACAFGSVVRVGNPGFNREKAEEFFDKGDMMDLCRYFPFIYELWFSDSGVDFSKYEVKSTQ